MPTPRNVYSVDPEVIDQMNEGKLYKDPLEILIEYEGHFTLTVDPYTFEEWINCRREENEDV